MSDAPPIFSASPWPRRGVLARAWLVLRHPFVLLVLAATAIMTWSMAAFDCRRTNARLPADSGVSAVSEEELQTSRLGVPGLTVSAMTPRPFSVGVGVNAHISAQFAMKMDPASLHRSTFRVLDANGTLLAGRISYNPFNATATFDSTVPLAYGQTFRAVLSGGPQGVRTADHRVLAGDVSWYFTTANHPRTGPGGPILVITSEENPFSEYYAEILRAEGLTCFSTLDISALQPESLQEHRLAILGEMPLTAEQVTMLTDWVHAGGHLIAMRPDKRLAGLLGLQDMGSGTDNGYLRIDTTTEAGRGLVADAIQFHGTADAYQLQGAKPLAMLAFQDAKPLDRPAVTRRFVGGHGGEAAAFVYDLARSVVYTRQGNPAWAGQERDGEPPLRVSDMFAGGAPHDPQPDWVDLTRVQIPQADEQQRLLVKIIELMLRDEQPLPRFWYLPRGAKAVVVLTGDDHSRKTQARLEHYERLGSVAGKPIHSTTYIYPEAIRDADAARAAARGAEITLHPRLLTTRGAARDWNSLSDLKWAISLQLRLFEREFPSLPAPITSRMHAIVWSDFDSMPKVEESLGLRLDTNYYYWPGRWTRNRPGLFTGSGMPMRFCRSDGTMLDVYQAATQLVDENDAAVWPEWSETLLENATGPKEFYVALVAQAHPDNPASVKMADAVIRGAQARNVPMLSAQELLRFLDARNGSSVHSLTWDAATGTLRFTLVAADGAEDVMAMLPDQLGDGSKLATLCLHNKAIHPEFRRIKGTSYALFPAVAGTYTATYAVDLAARLTP